MARQPRPVCPFAPIPNGMRIAIRWQKSGQNVLNIFHATAPAGVDMPTLELVAAAVDEWAGVTPLSQLPTDVVYRETTVTDMTAQDGPQVINADHAGQAGTNPGYSLPNNVTIAIHKATSNRGRGSAGRVYWPGLVSQQVTTTSTVSTAAANAIVSAYNSLAASLQALTPPITLVVAHSIRNGTCLDPQDISLLNTFTVTDLTVDSQRGRLPGRGR